MNKIFRLLLIVISSFLVFCSWSMGGGITLKALRQKVDFLRKNEPTIEKVEHGKNMYVFKDLWTTVAIFAKSDSAKISQINVQVKANNEQETSKAFIYGISSIMLISEGINGNTEYSDTLNRWLFNEIAKREKGASTLFGKTNIALDIVDNDHFQVAIF